MVLALILFYFFDYHIKAFILHITFFRDLLSLYFLTACLCSTFVIVLHVFLILQYYYMLLFSCVPLFSPANSEKTIVPTKITNTGVLYGSDSTPGLMLTVFFTFFLSTFLRFYAAKFIGSFIFSTTLLSILFAFSSRSSCSTLLSIILSTSAATSILIPLSPTVSLTD